MSDPKNPFESRDLESRSDQETTPYGGNNGSVRYRGGERRHQSRRKTTDRRTNIRFEVDNQDRRKEQGRRLDDGVDVSR
jgi:hypothetical protein